MAEADAKREAVRGNRHVPFPSFKEEHAMSRKSKEEILEDILIEARKKQGTEEQACVALTASTEIAPLVVEKNSLVSNVAKTLAERYDVTFPKDLRTLGTIDDAATYIVDNMDP
jgi:hypothetical protein